MRCDKFSNSDVNVFIISSPREAYVHTNEVISYLYDIDSIYATHSYSEFKFSIVKTPVMSISTDQNTPN